MLSATRIVSPLAEKRMSMSFVRRQLIGRRAYSDSIYANKTRAVTTPIAEASSQRSPIVSEEEIAAKIYTIASC